MDVGRISTADNGRGDGSFDLAGNQVSLMGTRGGTQQFPEWSIANKRLFASEPALLIRHSLDIVVLFDNVKQVTELASFGIQVILIMGIAPGRVRQALDHFDTQVFQRDNFAGVIGH